MEDFILILLERCPATVTHLWIQARNLPKLKQEKFGLKMGDRTPECGALGQAQMLLSLRGAFHLSYLHTNFPKRMKVSRIADYVGSSIGLILNNDLVTKMNTGYIIKIF